MARSFISVLMVGLALLCGGCLTIPDLRRMNAEQAVRIAELERQHEDYSRDYYSLKTLKETDDAKHLQKIDQLGREFSELRSFQTSQLSELAQAREEMVARHRADLDARASRELSHMRQIVDLGNAKEALSKRLADSEALHESVAELLGETREDLKGEQAAFKKARAAEERLTSEVAKLQKQVDDHANDAEKGWFEARQSKNAYEKRTSELEEEIDARQKEVKRLDQERKQLEDLSKQRGRVLEQRDQTDMVMRSRLRQLVEVFDSSKSPSLQNEEIEQGIRELASDLTKSRQGALPPNPTEATLLDAARDRLKQEIARQVLSVTLDPRGVVIIIPINSIFESREPFVRTSALGMLQRIAFLANDDRFAHYNLMVEGHTDSDPVRTLVEFISNLELSHQRALNVTRTLTEKVDPSVAATRVRAVACGEHYPIAPNQTSADKAKNRRVEIVFTTRYRTFPFSL